MVDEAVNPHCRPGRILKSKLHAVPDDVPVLDRWDDAGFLKTVFDLVRDREIVGFSAIAVDRDGKITRCTKLNNANIMHLVGGMMVEAWRLAQTENAA